MRNKRNFWFYAMNSQDRNYLMFVLHCYDVTKYSFFLWWINVNTCPLNKKDGKLRWFYLIPAVSYTAIQRTTENPIQGKAAYCGLLEAKERVFLQFAWFPYKLKLV